VSDDRTTGETPDPEADAETPAAEPAPRRRRRRAKAEPEAPAAEATEPEAADDATDDDVEAAEDATADADVEPTEDDATVVEPADDADEAPRPARRRRRGAAQVEEPAPAPARRARPPGDRVIVRAQARYVRTSARKARLVCDHIRGKSVTEARAILANTPRAVARDWSKLLESAVANAENNHELLGDDLRVHSVTADEGPTLKRFRPRAMGRATRIRKRTSHLTILLTPKEA
jgi:ribosomal protein L22